MASIFLSYSHLDLSRAEAIRRILQSEGYEVRYDQQIPLGVSWRDWLNENLRQASIVVVLWSRNSAEVDWVRTEAEAARHTSVLLPLIVDDLDPAGIPLGFGETQWLKCEWDKSGSLSSATSTRLLDAIRNHLNTLDPLHTAVEELRSELSECVGKQYEVVKVLGSGRLSMVFQVKDHTFPESPNRAIKVTPITGMLLLPSLAAQFRQGVLAAQKLNHENVVNIRELRLEKGVACTIMDFVDGAPLSQQMGQALPLDRVKRIAEGLASGLSYAHRNDIIHCNLRASSVLLGNDDRPVIFDFGRAKVRGAAGLSGDSAELFRDPQYISPEQCEGEPSTTRSDQYALGVILYELLTGVPPFVGKSAYAVMRAHCEEQPIPVSERRKKCPPEVCATVMRLLQKDPGKRYSRTSSVLEEILAWSDYERVSIPGDTRNRGHAAAAASALASYHRSLAKDPLLIDKLYERLREQEELRPHLAALNDDHQVRALQQGIPRLLSFSPEDARAAAYLDRLVTMHQPLGLAAKHFESFCDELVRLISETDLLPSEAMALDRTVSLRAVLAPTLARMIELCALRTAAPAPSSAPASGVRAGLPRPRATARTASEP